MKVIQYNKTYKECFKLHFLFTLYIAIPPNIIRVNKAGIPKKNIFNTNAANTATMHNTIAIIGFQMPINTRVINNKKVINIASVPNSLNVYSLVKAYSSHIK